MEQKRTQRLMESGERFGPCRTQEYPNNLGKVSNQHDFVVEMENSDSTTSPFPRSVQTEHSVWKQWFFLIGLHP